jgi:hypothetical protein
MVVGESSEAGNPGTLEDDGLVGVLKNILVGCTNNRRNQKSHNLSG